MKRKIAILLISAMVAAALSSCGSTSENASNDVPTVTFEEDDEEVPLTDTVDDELELETDNVDWQTYDSDLGWSVVYDANLIKVEKTDSSGGVKFEYTGEAEGTNMVTATWEKGKMPDDIIEELRATKEDDAEIDVSGGYFPGTTDKWAYWYSIIPMKKGSGPSRTYILGEYNGGTLVFLCATTREDDDEKNMIISDALALIIDSITFDDFKEQTLYENIPGKYRQEFNEVMDGEEYNFEYFVTLNEDHTGMLDLQDTIPIYWDDKVIISEDGEFKYFYTLEGDTLTIDYDGIDSIFYRE